MLLHGIMYKQIYIFEAILFIYLQTSGLYGGVIPWKSFAALVHYSFYSESQVLAAVFDKIHLFM